MILWMVGLAWPCSFYRAYPHVLSPEVGSRVPQGFGVVLELPPADRSLVRYNGGMEVEADHQLPLPERDREERWHLQPIKEYGPWAFRAPEELPPGSWAVINEDHVEVTEDWEREEGVKDPQIGELSYEHHTAIDGPWSTCYDAGVERYVTGEVEVQVPAAHQAGWSLVAVEADSRELVEVFILYPEAQSSKVTHSPEEGRGEHCLEFMLLDPLLEEQWSELRCDRVRLLCGTTPGAAGLGLALSGLSLLAARRRDRVCGTMRS